MLDDTQAQVAARLRGWRAEHVAKTWADIGYNYAVDGSGRKWNLTGNNVGAHAGGTPSGNSTIGNLTTVGVLLVLGQGEKPNAAMIQGVRELRAELLEALPKATKVYGHRDWAATECPGNAVYSAIKAGTFSGKPGRTGNPTKSQTLLEEIMSTASERKAFADEVQAAVWNTRGTTEKPAFPDGHENAFWTLVWAARESTKASRDAAATLALTKVLVERGTALTAAEIEAAVKAGIDAKIDTATVNLNLNTNE